MRIGALRLQHDTFEDTRDRFSGTVHSGVRWARLSRQIFDPQGVRQASVLLVIMPSRMAWGCFGPPANGRPSLKGSLTKL
jgi:hypothetical protein